MNSVAKRRTYSLLLAAAANPVTDGLQLCVGVIRESNTSQQQALWT